ncbi:type II secretion system minor pseudopilin GspI [Marinospirillum sp. MEB164]|uniref:Type II secretion system protein I n=2 Tax=Marinospirillum TaxID=64968 RepID=A0ABW8PYA2_9GAMM
MSPALKVDLPQQQGLTLIEVLVALLILAVLAASSTQVVSQAIDLRLEAEQRAVAHLCAASLLVEQQLATEWPDLGTQEGEQPQGHFICYWRIEVQGTPAPRLRRLDIEVGMEAARTRTLARVSGFVGQP